MADTGKGSSGTTGCNDRCGCPTPCPGGESCRCRLSAASSGDQGCNACACGEHCACNPCACPKTQTSAKGCTCGEGCTCATCAA